MTEHDFPSLRRIPPNQWMRLIGPSGRPSPQAPPDQIIMAKQMASEEFLRAEDENRSAIFCAYGIAPAPNDNVRGVGIGQRLTSGTPTGEWCIRIYVARKVPRAVLPVETLLPSQIGGFPIDVIESGKFWSFQIPSYRGELRPAQPGCSIGVRFPDEHLLMAGTLGAVTEAGGKLYILSNNHVMAGENLLSPGTDILQPGSLDHPTPQPIAKLTAFGKLDQSQANGVDCAIAEVTRHDIVNSTFLPSVGQLRSGTPAAAIERMKVEKIGRTSGYTRGEIVDTNADVKVGGYRSGSFLFRNQLLVQGERRGWLRQRQWFSRPGDSGAVIVAQQSKAAVGLLIGGSEGGLTLGSPIERVLAEFGVTLVT